jgi:hypothetical protein
MAWAVGENHRRWDFGKNDFWPKSVPKRLGIAYLVNAYQTIGFVVCTEADGRHPEVGFDKIVLYINNQSEGSHAAKLLQSGMWSSKLGDEEDIDHQTPEGLSGSRYGRPYLYMKRPRRSNVTAEIPNESNPESQ